MRGKKIKTYISAYLFIIPSFLFLGVFTYWPIFRSFWYSLTRYNLSTPQPIFCGFSNYLKMINASLFWKVLNNTLLYSAGTVIVSVSLGLLFAVLLHAKTLRFKSIFRFSLFYPYVLPMAAASMVWLWMLNPSYGVINLLLGKVGFPAHIDWVNNGDYALLAVIIVGIWKYTGYYTIIFLAGLQGIDYEFYEAATIEGANFWNKFTHITFPLLTPTSFFVVIISVINSFQSVDQVYVMTQGGPYDSSNVLLYYIYQNAFMYGDLGYGSTISFFLLIVLLIGTVLYFLGLNRWVHYER